MLNTDVTRTGTKLTILVAGMACLAAVVRADGPGHSFTSLTSPYTQELFGVTAAPVASGLMGGVAFAPDGDVWGGECWGSQYHRYDRQGTASDGHGGAVHPESLVDLSTYAPAPIGCGIVNHPEGFLGIPTLYANTPTGLWPVASDTGQPILGGPLNSPTLYAGNGRGIDVDPVTTTGNHHTVYVGADCDPNVRDAATCSLFDYDSAMESTLAFARFSRAAGESFESLNFSPDGSSAFVSYRDASSGQRGFVVIGRPVGLLGRGIVDDSQVVRRIPMSAMPQGIAFRAAGDFAVTLNEDGTMTRLVFPGANFTGAPSQSTFASGGFVGGLLRVGADGCIYAPQSANGASGVRFGDNATSDSDSIVRICGGFAPAPGVAGGDWGAMPGSISGAAFADWDRDGVKDAGEPGLNGVTISLTGPASDSALTDASGAYSLANVAEGLYSVSAPADAGGLAGNPTPLAVQVGAGQAVSGVDFPYVETTAPVCSSVVHTGTPTRVTFTLRDDGSGVRRVIVGAVSNFQVSVNGSAAVTGPATFDFPSPIAGDVVLVATQSAATQAANVQLDVVDAFGSQTSCAASVPAGTTPPSPPPPDNDGQIIRKELSGWGRHHVAVVDRLPGTMRYVTIRNGRKGVEAVDIKVNRRWYRVVVRDGQVKSVDVGRALEAGRRNRIVLVGWGRSHDSAVVTISSRP